MRRLLPVLLPAAVLLAGCPLPQPLPDYPAGNVTPPRILTDGLASASGTAVTFVPANCATQEPTYTLRARVSDTNTIETIEARWFVNYDRDSVLNRQPQLPGSGPIPPNADTTILERQVPLFTFKPYDYEAMPGTSAAPGPSQDAGLTRIVELVVSNGFDPSKNTEESKLPFRMPLLGFETQVHRWVFVTVPPSAKVPCCESCTP